MSVLKDYPVSFLSTYPPNRCGIGTFTKDLVTSISDIHSQELSSSDHLKVVALNDRPEGYDYGQNVAFEIEAGNQMDYRRAADYINISASKALSVQHEFGIFGGEDGEYLLTTLNHLNKPVVTTLHTVLKNPSDHQREVLTEVCRQSTALVVLAHKATEILSTEYGVPEEKVFMIPHGAPDVPFLDTSYYKEDFGFEGRLTILTFGLLSPNKGIEMGIDAMERVVKKFPDALYIILGATHPNVKRERGEEYRVSLKQRVRKKGLEDNVVFQGRFVPKEELKKYLVSADIYLTPYRSKEQISSGTLAYAVAMGKAVVSTPYWYAEELLDEGRGRLVPFDDTVALGDTLTELLGDEEARQKMRRRSYQFGQSMLWHEVATSYTQLFREAEGRYEKQVVQAGVDTLSSPMTDIPELPNVKLDHLRNLTDGTGILQHASFTVPKREHGYTTDDNARAALAMLRHWRLFDDETVLPLLNTYLSFLQYAVECGEGRARNFMNYDRNWIPAEEGSEDSHGRTVWALGHIIAECPGDWLGEFAMGLFHRSISITTSFTSPRAWAFSILGTISYLKKFGGDRNARLVCKELGEKLLTLFQENATEDWPWGEDIVSYENARLPQALLSLGRYLEEEEYLSVGKRALDWLIEVQISDEGGHLSLIGNDGWFSRGEHRANFDQQPVELAALIDATHEAYLATGKSRYLEDINRAFWWFLGQNDLALPLYNFRTGGCRDGLQPTNVNQNEGAEAQLSWLLSLYTMYEILGEI